MARGFEKVPCTYSPPHITLGDYYSEIDSDDRFTVSLISVGDCDSPILVTGENEIPFTSKIEYEFKLLTSDNNYSRTSYFFKGKKTYKGSWFLKAGDERISKDHNWPEESRRDSLRFIVVGDMDNSETAQPTIKALSELRQRDIEFVLHTGDFAYNINDDLGMTGDRYFDRMSNVFSSEIPYIITPGNHEDHFEADSGRMLDYRFKMPGAPPIKDHFNNIYYYSFKIKHVRFMSVDFDYALSDTTGRRKNKIIQWMDQVLTTDNKDRKEFIFYSHRPIYCGEIYGDIYECKRMFWYLRAFEAVLLKHKVSLMLHSHLHSYSRSKPFIDWKLGGSDTTKPISIIAGHSGAKWDFKYHTPANMSIPAFIDNIRWGNPNYLQIEINTKGIEGRLIDSITSEVIDQWLITSNQILFKHTGFSFFRLILYSLLCMGIGLATASVLLKDKKSKLDLRQVHLEILKNSMGDDEKPDLNNSMEMETDNLAVSPSK